jgi:Leucine-rich repeat (LRR) protein
MRMALVVLFICTLTAVAADSPRTEEKAAMEFVVKSEGKASIDPHLPAEAPVFAKFEKVSDAVLIGLKKHPQIGGIDMFDASKCTYKGFAALKELPNLHKLVLGKAELTAAGATSIGQCKELRHLGLVNTGLTDTGLANLKKLTLLEHLAISGNPKITDKGMQTVKGFERLRVLYLGNTSITDEGLMELKGLEGLRTLSVSGTKVTQDAAEKFADDMPNLRAVRR